MSSSDSVSETITRFNRDFELAVEFITGDDRAARDGECAEEGETLKRAEWRFRFDLGVSGADCQSAAVTEEEGDHGGNSWDAVKSTRSAGWPGVEGRRVGADGPDERCVISAWTSAM
jgi:hypothetical protein